MSPFGGRFVHLYGSIRSLRLDVDFLCQLEISSGLELLSQFDHTLFELLSIEGFSGQIHGLFDLLIFQKISNCLCFPIGLNEESNCQIWIVLSLKDLGYLKVVLLLFVLVDLLYERLSLGPVEGLNKTLYR